MECYFTTGYLKCNIPLNTGQKRKLPTHVCVFFMHATEGTLDCRWNHGPLGITPKTLKVARIKPDTVDGRNPAPADRWFIHVYPTIYRVSTIQGGAGCRISSIHSMFQTQQTSTTTPSKRSYILSVSRFSHHGTCQYNEIVAATKDMQTLRPFPNGEQYSQPMVLELLLHFLVVFSTHPKIFHWMAPLVFSMCWMNFMNMTNMFFWLVVEPPLWKILVSWGYYSHF